MLFYLSVRDFYGNFISFVFGLGKPVRNIEIKKRYAYLVNWKRRKFHNYTQGWHSGSHAIAWAAITTFVCTGFLRPPIQNVAFAVPRLNRIFQINHLNIKY